MKKIISDKTLQTKNTSNAITKVKINKNIVCCRNIFLYYYLKISSYLIFNQI